MQACTQGRKSNFQAFLLWVRLAFKFINLAYGSQLGTRGVSPCKEITTHTGAPAHKKAQTDRHRHTMDTHANDGRQKTHVE